MTTRNITPLFIRAFKHTVGVEGAYSNHPHDPGGETMWGITKRVAKSWGYYGEMRDMPIATAREIYFDLYWRKVGGASLEKVAPNLALILFDIGVNVGPGQAVKWLQTVLNSLNLQEAKYADISVDGGWGPKTLGALETLLTWRGSAGEGVVITGISCLQGAHYINISINKPDLETFVFGWLSNRVHMQVKVPK